MELKKETFEKKILAEACWLDLIEDVKVRIDYPSNGQMMEVRRLRNLWDFQEADKHTPHFYEAYLSYTVKDVTGYTIEGKLAKYQDGNLVTEDASISFFAVLVELGLIEVLVSKIMARLAFDEVEKKSLKSQPDLSRKEDSLEGKSSKNPTSSTHGLELIHSQVENG